MKMKLAGATYVDVHKAGGGINFTVRSVRAASEAELEALLEERLDRMLACGTPTAEVKSGYGLDTATEMKMLRVITNVNKRHPVRLEATFCGAHSVPEGHTAESMTEDVVAGQLPELVRLRDAGDIAVSNVDVFCEEGFFDADQSRRILEDTTPYANTACTQHIRCIDVQTAHLAMNFDLQLVVKQLDGQLRWRLPQLSVHNRAKSTLRQPV